ncbi:MAG: CHASE2 domain-containing protein [Alphaproteobacteria bacterium]|nr:CHASE2 domain-containing protein [Alphaproteobacteria bacterium]
MADQSYAVFATIDWPPNATSETIACLFEALDDQIQQHASGIPGLRSFKGIGGRVVLIPSDVKATLNFAQDLLHGAASVGVKLCIGITHGHVQDVNDAAGANVAGDSVNRAARLTNAKHSTLRIAVDRRTWEDARDGFNEFRDSTAFIDGGATASKQTTQHCFWLNHGRVKFQSLNETDGRQQHKQDLAHVVLYDIERFSSLSQRDMAAKTFELKEAVETAIRLRGEPLLGSERFFHASAGDGGALAFRADGIGGKAAWAFAQNLLDHADERVKIRIGIATGQVAFLEDYVDNQHAKIPVGTGVLEAERLSNKPEAGGACVTKRFWNEMLDDADRRYWETTEVPDEPDAYIVTPTRIESVRLTKIDFFKKYCLFFALIFFGYLFYANVNLFDINRITKNHSTDLYYKIKAPDYPQTYQDEMTVVLLDEPSLRDLGGRWPATYEFHAAILERIAQLSPRAIVIGLLFLDDRSDTDDTLTDLSSILNDLERGTEDIDQTRVFLASLTGDSAASGVIEPLKKWTYSAVISWPTEGATGRSPLFYPLSTGAGRTGNDPSAAFRIYRYICSQGHKACGNTGKPAFAEPMQIYWGVKPTANPFDVSETQDCNPVEEGVFARWLQWFTAASKRFRQNCSYTPQMSAFSLMNGEEEDVRRMIEDRVVFYGAGFTGQSDAINSPNHGRQPSVFLHAMAFDNLLTMGTEYHRWAEGNMDNSPLKSFIANIDHYQIITLLLISLFSIFLIVITDVARNYYNFIHINTVIYQILFLILYQIFITIGILICVFGSFTAHNFGNFDWIGLLILTSPPIVLNEFREWKRLSRSTA